MTAEVVRVQVTLEDVWDDLANKVAEICPDMKGEIAAIRAKGAQQKKEREELVKKCHPDNTNHWPPNIECPVCQKLLGRVENLAKNRCTNPDDDKELQEKFDEVFEELYLKKSEPENKETPQ
jgi:hypothetical protein